MVTQMHGSTLNSPPLEQQTRITSRTIPLHLPFDIQLQAQQVSIPESMEFKTNIGKKQLEPALANTGVALNEFGKNQLASAMGRIGMVLGHFGEHNLGSAAASTGRALEQFGKNQLTPALEAAGREIGGLGEHHVVPAVGCMHILSLQLQEKLIWSCRWLER